MNKRPSFLSIRLIALCIAILCIIGGFLVTGPVCCLLSADRILEEYADIEFRRLVGPAVWDSGFQLMSNRTREYNERIIIFAHNSSRYKLWFPDKNLGMRAFQFHKERMVWEPVAIPETIFTDPGPLELYPRPTWPYAWMYGFDAQKIAGVEPRKIRFLAVGLSETNERYAAYVDVEIGAIPKDAH